MRMRVRALDEICAACVMSVRENLHLPVKKEHLKKFANIPQQPQDDEVRT